MDKSNENQQALEQRNMQQQTVKKKRRKEEKKKRRKEEKKKRNFLINLFLKGVSFIANIERVLSFWDRFDQ